ncbi:MFS transporter [Chryseobacterium capnotolerans]|uniref:MFS transporter n=1 Tax=Chryseobacterium capnotolerans TaxID=2759528 RepID=UPI0024B5DDA0|nr:MFS transporter [Chryseobacterium capnotolerans]
MTETSPQKTSIKKILPLILATAIFMQMLDSTILNTSLPSIAKDLHESPLNMQNAIISYVLTLAVFMPASGFLADRFGTKKVFIFFINIIQSWIFILFFISKPYSSCYLKGYSGSWRKLDDTGRKAGTH